MIYLRLVPGWFRLYVGFVRASFEKVWVGVVYIGLLGVCLIGFLEGLRRLGLWFL